MKKIVVVKNLKKYFRARSDIATLFSKDPGRFIRAVDDVSFDISEGEILGLVGESGSGKTTIGRLLLRLEETNRDEIYVDGQKITTLKGKDLKQFYRNVQMIFQDPFGSINPRFTVFDTVAEPARVQNLTMGKKPDVLVTRALESAGLKPPRLFFKKFPHELSGGERQRLSIARALIVQPKVLIADEPVSMLDVSVKAGILNLLKSLSKDLRMSILYISHDLSTVKYICNRIIIMYLGKFMEIGYANSIIDEPKHPYAKALKAAIPIPDPSFKRNRIYLENMHEKSRQIISGCRYRLACKFAMDVCAEEEPILKGIEKGRLVACHLF